MSHASVAFLRLPFLCCATLLFPVFLLMMVIYCDLPSAEIQLSELSGSNFEKFGINKCTAQR